MIGELSHDVVEVQAAQHDLEDRLEKVENTFGRFDAGLPPRVGFVTDMNQIALTPARLRKAFGLYLFLAPRTFYWIIFPATTFRS